MRLQWMMTFAVLFCCQSMCFAETTQAQSTPPDIKAPTTSLRLITSSSIPPYVIIEEDRGIVTDLMREALALKNYEVNFSYSTNKRLMAELVSKRVDGAFNFPPGNLAGFYYSDPIVSYQNVAIALSANHFEINQISDLTDKAVIAFQNSALFLGPEYKKMIENNPRHDEVSKQRSQLFMLFMERTDVIVMEINIFFYYLQEIQQLSGIQRPFTIYPIFPKAPRFAVFSDVKVRDDFNEGLKLLKENGQYHIIFHRYIAEQ